jgi:hypothetical protein
MTYLPHRHTDKSVRRFVPVLETLLSNHKTLGEYPVQFDPNTLGISVETGLARLRDAVHSIVNGLTTYPNISPSELGSVWPRYHVISDGTNIIVAPKQANANATQLHVSTKLATLTVRHPYFSDLLTAFAVLLGHRIFQGEVQINGELDPTLQQQLEATYDIVISATGPNQHTML